jgi:hypothetical protein
MPHDFDSADTLIYSDDPEALSATARSLPVRVTTPMDAIIYEAQVGPGRKRVFYYHQNFDPDPRSIGVRLTNLGTAELAMRTLAYVERPVAGDVVGVGHRSIVGFLRALIAGHWTPLTLQPRGSAGDDAVVAVAQARQGELASAFLEVDLPAGALLKVQVITAGAHGSMSAIGKNGPGPGQGDGIGRSGVFDLTRGGTVEGDFAALSWDAADGEPLEITVPDGTFPNRQVPFVNPPRGPAEAVYGVLTRRTVTVSNSGDAAVEVGVYAQAAGGRSPGTFMVNDDIIQLGTMESPDRPPRPGYEMHHFTVPANDSGTIAIDLLGTVDPSGSDPLKIVLAPRGTLAPPSSGKQVVFLPGGPPWRA